MDRLVLPFVTCLAYSGCECNQPSLKPCHEPPHTFFMWYTEKKWEGGREREREKSVGKTIYFVKGTPWYNNIESNNYSFHSSDLEKNYQSLKFLLWTYWMCNHHYQVNHVKCLLFMVFIVKKDSFHIQNGWYRWRVSRCWKWGFSPTTFNKWPGKFLCSNVMGFFWLIRIVLGPRLRGGFATCGTHPNWYWDHFTQCPLCHYSPFPARHHCRHHWYCNWQTQAEMLETLRFCFYSSLLLAR